MTEEQIAQINWCRDRIETAALQYARVKCLSCYLEADGRRVVICHSDCESMERNFIETMKYEAISLLRLLEAPLPERLC